VLFVHGDEGLPVLLPSRDDRAGKKKMVFFALKKGTRSKAMRGRDA
jgi:DNA-binding cell septation regulator SpoVG